MSWLPPTREGFVRFFGFFKKNRRWAALIATINLVGIVYGFYYYADQFASTPWWLWWLVPDSPLAVLWAELALVAFWLRRKPGVLDVLAFVGNVQVGLWTVYVLLAYEPHFGTLDVFQGGELELNTVLLVGHAGMAVLALVFLEGLRERARVAPRAAWLALLIGGGYYLMQDAVDYFGPGFHARGSPAFGCGLRPYTVPCDPALEPALALVTFGLTLGGVALLAWTMRTRTNNGRT